MNDSSIGCIIGGLLYPGVVAIFVGSGFLAWEWADPKSFWGALCFLIAWAVLAKVGYFIGSLVLMGISFIFEQFFKEK